MSVSYNKLWRLMLDKKIKKMQLREMTGISAITLAKLGKGQRVSVDVMLKICIALNCDICDIMEMIDDTQCMREGFAVPSR